MSIQIFQNGFIPQYENGKWIWNDNLQKFEFKPNLKKPIQVQCPKNTFVTFKKSLTQVEEMTFIRGFQRTAKSRDSDVIILQDIKDLALFLASFGRVPKDFIEFFHANTTDEFLLNLIIYFAYFLKLWEFLLIQRDGQQSARVSDIESIGSELPEYLSQYRLLLARSYGQLLVGDSDSKPFHHMSNNMKKSFTERDRGLIETLLVFSIEIVWIAMHRKSYKIIGKFSGCQDLYLHIYF